MAEQLWVAPLKRGNIASATVQNSFTQMTQISPIPDVVVPANTLTPGTALKVQASGRFGTNGTPTLTFALYWGSIASGVQICSTAALTTFTSANSSVFRVQFDMLVRTEGSTGSAWTTGDVTGITSTTQVANAPPSQAAAITIDTTTAKQLVLGAAFSAQHGLNDIVIDNWQVVG